MTKKTLVKERCPKCTGAFEIFGRFICVQMMITKFLNPDDECPCRKEVENGKIYVQGLPKKE
jgi:hypothetical protein